MSADHARPEGLQRRATATRRVALNAVSKRFGSGDNAVLALDRISLQVRTGRVRLPGRRLRLRQDHPAQPGRRARPRHVRRGRAQRQGRPDVPGGRAVPLAVGGQERRAGAAAARRAPQRSASPAVLELLELVRLERLRRQAAPPAVRRHAPAGRPGPGPGPGGRRPPHGRALRRPRRHDPRRHARRAGAHLEGDAVSRSCSSPTTCGRPPAWPTGSWSSPAGPGGWRPSSSVDIHRPRRIEAPDVSALTGRGHGPAPRGGGSPWPSLSASCGNVRSRSSPASTPSRPSRSGQPSLRSAGLGLAVAQARSPSASSSVAGSSSS